MKQSNHIVCLFYVVTIFFLFGLMVPQGAAKENPTDDKKETSAATEEQKATFIQLYSWATILPKELIDLQNKLNKEKNLHVLEEELPILSKEVDLIRLETTTAKTNPILQLPQIINFKDKSQRITTRLNKLSESITFSISFLSAKRKEWKVKKNQIVDLEQSEEISFALAEEQYQNLVETVNKALLLVEEQLKRALTFGKKIGDLQIIIYSIESDLASLDTELRTTSISQTAPSMLSADFYSQINYSLIQQSYKTTRRFISEGVDALKNKFYFVLLGSLILFLASTALYKTKNLARPNGYWYPFSQCPLGTTVFIASSLNALVNILPLNTDIPRQWEALLHIVTLLAVIRLINHLVKNRGHRKLLIRLTTFMAVTMTLFLVGLPQILILLYVFYVSILALVYYFFKFPSTKGKRGAELWIKRIWGIFPFAVLLFCISGYDQLAVISFSTLLATIIACLILWVLYLLVLGFLELFLSILPFSLIRENHSAIVRSMRPIIAWLHILLLVALQCVIWGFYPTFDKAIGEINDLGFDFAGMHVSTGFIFTVVLIAYGSFHVSKAIQILLLKKILPRYKAEKGVQLSIARLVHYAILSIGFLIMLRVLGFQLNQLTLLGGALGIGIGFGLQAIVNNFASGLILLFERPIKVGDTIQIGADFGEVKSLGLRATIIQTFDNAEIVVPNSDLITGQVTNWTLAERKVRIRIPVGVAYGTDVAKVLEVLTGCAQANPMVLSNPAPSAFFLAFGNSSLDFELRVWILEFLNKTQVLSDLNQDIESEFEINNIEVPFPQSDLHLRSVDEMAAFRLSGMRTPATPAAEHPSELPKVK